MDVRETNSYCKACGKLVGRNFYLTPDGVSYCSEDCATLTRLCPKHTIEIGRANLGKTYLLDSDNCEVCYFEQQEHDRNSYDPREPGD